MRFSSSQMLALILIALQLTTTTANAQTRASPEQAAAARAFVSSLDIAALDQRIEGLRAQNHRLLLPGLTIGLGVSALVIGGAVFASAWSSSYDDSDINYNVAKDRAGLVLMPIGAIITLVGIPLFAVRLARTLRLRRAEDARERFPNTLRLSGSASGDSVGVTLFGSL